MNYMPVPIQDLPKKTFDQSSVHSMPHFAVSCPSWWISDEQPMPQSSSMNLSLKAESPPQHFHDRKYLGLQLPDQESSSAQSIGQTHREVCNAGGTISQDQCSSDSGQDETCGKGVEGQMKPVFLLSNSEIVFNQPHVDYNHSMVQTLYPSSDHYSIFTPYVPQALIQPQIGSQMVGIAPARVPLPLDPSEDGPIYVNPKQYHGILRRRQSRAKLEAQNKLVKARRPYLHESRHLHALNRVRGSGGRFLGTKKLQQSDSNGTNSSNDISASTYLQQNKGTSDFQSCSGSVEYVASTTTGSNITRVSKNEVSFQQPDRGFSGISAQMGGPVHSNGGRAYRGMQHCASVVR